MRPSSNSSFDLPDFDLRGAIDDLRETFGARMAGARGGAGASRDIRSAILTELATAPMHGYQLIQAIQERSHGTWTPTPGAVYPELQLLADEGLATSQQDGERKVYTLTEAGMAAAAAAAAATAQPEAAPRGASRRPWDSERGALPKAGAKLAQAIGQVGLNASTEQQERAVAIIDEARKKLYAILAED